jgi:hypothetical protein
VTSLGGHVLKKLGDGLMALFGYPHAQENDAERAVRAALAIQRALVEINARNAIKGASELSARIGLDSGQVVVDATGEVFGDAPNIAARVQSAAGPGSIFITATVQRQTAGLFVAEDRGQHELKGVSAPMTLYRVVRASGGGRRGGARALTPLVRREEELALLTRRWERAHKGEGQLALIVGEPGLGKSRLMEEFHGRLGETPHTWVEWSSSQLSQNTPLHPIAEWGRQRFGADLPTEQSLADLEHTLRLVGLDPTEYTPLLAPLVDVVLQDHRATALAPEELRRHQLAAIVHVNALHDDDDRAGAFVVEAGQQGVLEPFVGRIAFGLGIAVVGLQRIVDNDQIAAAAGQRAPDRGRQPKSPYRQLNLALRILLPDPRAWEQRLVPGRLKDCTKIVRMLLGEIARVRNADDAPGRIVPRTKAGYATDAVTDFSERGGMLMITRLVLPRRTRSGW